MLCCPALGQGPVQGQRLIVQFAPQAQVRPTSGGLMSLTGADLTPILALASANSAQFESLLELDETEAQELEDRAWLWSGVPQPDLLGQLFVQVLPGADLEALLLCFAASPLIAWADIETYGVLPPTWTPDDYAPTTTDFSGDQGYLGPDPGINAQALHAVGVTGSGVRVSDVEYGWIETHEDLVDADLVNEPGVNPPLFVEQFGFDEHGTAAIGVLAAPWNGYGVNGLIPDGQFGLYPEQDTGGPRRAEAILSALTDSIAGDVILLEMQAIGADGKLAPAETELAVHSAVKMATDSGVVVVAAAGNGAADLDGPAYAGYLALGDSGAIVVGAGSADTVHATESYSTYGSRVDLQAWGSTVLTTGYGDFATFGGDGEQTYTQFSRTSAASALVAGGAALIQSYALETLGAPLPPKILRALLVDTGLPGGPGGAIGPALDLGAALERFSSPWDDLGLGTPGLLGQSTLSGISPGAPSSPYVLNFANGLNGAGVTLTVGATRIDIPLLGCLLVPSPDTLIYPGIFNADQALQFSSALETTLPPGTQLYLQAFFPDPGGPQAVASTNALLFTLQ